MFEVYIYIYNFIFLNGAQKTFFKTYPWEWSKSSSAVKMQTGNKCQWLVTIALKAVRYKYAHEGNNIHEGGWDKTNVYVDIRVNIKTV